MQNFYVPIESPTNPKLCMKARNYYPSENCQSRRANSNKFFFLMAAFKDVHSS